jgi:hypothetical protein
MAQYIGTKNLIEVYQKIAELQQAAMNHRLPTGSAGTPTGTGPNTGNSPIGTTRQNQMPTQQQNLTQGQQNPQNQGSQNQNQPQPTQTQQGGQNQQNTAPPPQPQTRGQKRARKPSVTSDSNPEKKIKVKTERDERAQRRDSAQPTPIQQQQQPPQQPQQLPTQQNTGYMHNPQLPMGQTPQPPPAQQNQSEMYINDLLEQNLIIIANIRNNIAHRKINDNITLISKFRENIIQVLTCMSKMSGIMSQMPPIPVKLNTICIPQQQQNTNTQQSRSTPSNQQQ